MGALALRLFPRASAEFVAEFETLALGGVTLQRGLADVGQRSAARQVHPRATGSNKTVIAVD